MTRTLMTADQFGLMKTGELEDYELVGGELIPLSSGTPKHGLAKDWIVEKLRGYLRTKGIGRAISEIDCRLSEDTVRRPDVAVFLGSRLRQADLDRIPIPFAPDIAIEVLSASETMVDVNRKVLSYLASGTQEVWIVDYSNAEIFIQTDRTMRIVRGDEPLQCPLLPGFSILMDDLEAEL